MGHLFNTGKAPAQKEDVKSPEVIDTNETADSAVRARRRKRYGAEQTFTAKGAGTFGQGSGSAGSNFRKTLG